jgi:hypothetical protein
MKRLLLTFCLLSVVMAVSSVNDIKPFSAKNYWKYSNKLIANVWFSGVNARSDYFDPDSGGKTTFIIHGAEMKAYAIFEERKQIMVLNIEQLKKTNDFVGLDIMANEQKDKKLIGVEDVEGRECYHYEYRHTTLTVTGVEEVTVNHQWFYPPLNCPIQQSNGGYDEPTVLRNIQEGPQPAHLFEVPKEGYTVIALPAGGLMELITGKSRDANQKSADSIRDAFQEAGERVKNALNSSDDPKEQLKAIQELLNESKKKK